MVLRRPRRHRSTLSGTGALRRQEEEPEDKMV